MNKNNRYRHTTFLPLLLFMAQIGMAQLDSLKNLGHASMKIKTSDGKIIYIDPYAGTDYADSADILLITHSHGDHNNPLLVKLKAGGTQITYAQANLAGVYQSYTVGGIKIDAVAAYNSNHPKNSCVGYVLEFNGIKLYHAGDTGKISEMADLAARELSYALLPMDSIYTMSPQGATEAAEMIQANQFIPIHTMPPPDTYSDDKVSRFNVPNKIILKNGQSIALVSNPTSVTDFTGIPANFLLAQNYPNPFNPTTEIKYSVGTYSYTSLRVYDVLGRGVATLVNEMKPAGTYTVQWNATDMPSGVYFYELAMNGTVQTRKMILQK